MMSAELGKKNMHAEWGKKRMDAEWGKLYPILS